MTWQQRSRQGTRDRHESPTRRGSGGFGTRAVRSDRSGDTPSPLEQGSSADEPGDGASADPESAARSICLRLLDRRPRTRAELVTALAARGIPDATSVRVLERFAEVGLIDDTALAQGYAAALHRDRGLSGRAVAQKLRQRGVDDEAVAEAVETIDSTSERAAAQALVAKRLPALSRLPAEVRLRRLVALLGRKGYSTGLAYDVVRRALGADPATDDPDGMDD